MTLDADAEAVLRAAMAERGLSFKQALNDAVRRSSVGPVGPVRATRVRDLGSSPIDLDHSLTIAADLEDAELVRRLRTGQ